MTDNRSVYYTSSYHVSRMLRPGEFQTAVALAAESGSGVTNKDRIYLTLVNTANFHPGDTVLIVDSVSPSGEQVQIQSVVEAAGNSYLETTADMTKEYTTGNSATVQLLSYYIRDGEGTGLDRRISTREINDMINEVEARIDKVTGHAWTTRTETKEIHDYPMEYRDVHDWFDGIPIKLNHRAIKTLATASGDSLELYEGSTGYSSKLATWTLHTDYWIDETLGFLYLKKYWKWHSRAGIRITYRYGDATVPDDIRLCATMMTCIMMLEMEVMQGIEDENNLPNIEKWQKKVNDILRDHEEMHFYHR